MTPEEDREWRFDRLERLLSEGRILRNKWRDDHGNVCLLGALSDEVAINRDAGYCPGYVLPYWMACLTPIIDDRGTERGWRGIVHRYVRVLRSATLSKERWEALRFRVSGIYLRYTCLHNLVHDDYSKQFMRFVATALTSVPHNAPDLLALRAVQNTRETASSYALRGDVNALRSIYEDSLFDVDEAAGRREYDDLIIDVLNEIEKEVNRG